jgi:hypothetical protein
METMPTPPRITTPGGGAGGSNAALYAQVVALQRQLASRTEELAQLRRQLDAVGEGGAGALSERLRIAERDAQMWKDRALAAERRVVVFERFLARVKWLREKRQAELRGRGKEGGEIDEAEIERVVEQEMEALNGEQGREAAEAGQVDGTSEERVWLMAAREMIEYDDERKWMGGGS